MSGERTSPPQVKICGLTRAEDAQLAASLGAAFLGFIFVKSSPRYRTAEEIARIADALGARRPKLVGVFRDEEPEVVRAVARKVPLDLIQLHGSESEADIRVLGLPVIKTIHMAGALPDTALHPTAEWLLFDTPGGGTGRRFDWSLLQQYDRKKRFLLAGGIHAGNVAEAIAAVRPDAIDLASGVESAPGIKDHTKLRELFERIER